MRAWRIDSLDAKAGFAFASHREPWDDAFLLGEETTVLFQPPDFVAQRISSPSVAHAAARATFQLGLYEEPEVEVAFPQLDAVREFVRCAYLRASGDDVPPAGEAPPPLRPDLPGGSGPDLGSVEESEQDAVTLLQTYFRNYARASNEMRYEEVARGFDRLDGARFEAPGMPPTTGARRLGRAGLRLLWELKRRAPLGAEKSDWATWTRSAATLARSFDRLQLWPLLARHFGPSIRGIAEDLLAGLMFRTPLEAREWIQPFGGELFLLRHLMLTGWVNPVQVAALRAFDVAPAAWGLLNIGPSEAAGHAAACQPFESLALLPIPSSVATLTTATAPSDASLRHLLLALTAAPWLLGRMDSAGSDASAELLLFAACFLTSVPEPRRQASYPQEILLSGSLTGAADYAELESVRSIAIALHWLSRNLPAWVFAARYADMIDRALNVSVAEPAGVR